MKTIEDKVKKMCKKILKKNNFITEGDIWNFIDKNYTLESNTYSTFYNIESMLILNENMVKEKYNTEKDKITPTGNEKVYVKSIKPKLRRVLNMKFMERLLNDY